MQTGPIRRFARGFGWILNPINGVETWFHPSDFLGNRADIKDGLLVEYTVLDYVDRNKIARTKAINIKPVAPQGILSLTDSSSGD